MHKAFFTGKDIMAVNIFNVISVNRVISQIIRKII